MVDDVHEVLGRHRDDSQKKNSWISGLTEEEGKLHPTIGCLRIGKPLPETPGEMVASSQEWQSDGVYFHYLTRWAWALDLLAQTTTTARYATEALELLDTAHKKFVYNGGGVQGHRRMYWKMSIDLSRPLVKSQGHHDPLDGFLTCLQLEDTRKKLSLSSGPSLLSADFESKAAAAAKTFVLACVGALEGDVVGVAAAGEAAAVAAHAANLEHLKVVRPLQAAIEDFKSMVEPTQLATDDALGIGGLLCDICRLSRLDIASEKKLLEAIVVSAEFGLQRYLQKDDLRQPPEHRLAFRELGLSIGLAGVARTPFARRFEPYQRIRTLIETFWGDPVNRQSKIYIEHEDINDVMLATSLSPEGYLNLTVK